MPRTSDARDRIVSTAARLFLERSYQAVGVDELCQAADVRKGSFYHYFCSKSELAKAVIDLHARSSRSGLSGSPDATPAQKLHAIPDAIGASRPRWNRSSGAPSAALSGTSPPSCRRPTRICERTSPGGSARWKELAAACHEAAEEGILRGDRPGPARPRTPGAVPGHHPARQAQRLGRRRIAPALHDFIDGYLVDARA